MELKKLVLVGVFLFLIIFSLSIISAKSCSVQSSCNAANTVMKLSSTTNAHGSLYNQGSYNNFLCCDFSGTHSNDGNNKIVGLSSTTNAHAEIPTLSNYGTGVYFGDLKCVSGSSCPSGYDIPMISLSSTTNAHLGSFNSYLVKICCCAPGEWEWTDNYQCVGNMRQRQQRRTLCPSGYNYQWVDDACPSGERCIGSGQCIDNCIFTNAYWSQSSAVEGENIQMILEGTNCDGKSVSFKIYEDDLVGDDFVTTVSGTFDRETWTAEWQDDGSGNPEYYFTAILDAYTAMTKTSGLLDVSCKIGEWEWTDNYQCNGDLRQREQRQDICPHNAGSGYNYQWVDDACPSGERCIGSGQCIDNCIFTNAYWSQSSAVEGENIQMILEGTNCDGKSVSFKIYEDDLVGDDFVTTVSGTFDRETWTAEWQDDGSGNPEYYFTAILDAYTAMTKTSGLLDLKREIYWMDMDGNRISEADFGDTVQMIITWTNSGTFEIKENNLLFDDEIKTIDGVSVGNDVIAKWTITQEDLDKADDYDEFYFKVDEGEKSEYLKINLNKNDDPTNITILSPECGEYFDEGVEIIIDVIAVDTDDIISGTISIDGSIVETFSNGGISSNKIFNSPGNFQIIVETISNRGERARMISNIMILEKDGENYVDGKYAAACITKPKDYSYIDGGEVEFDASTTRAIKITDGVLDLLIPDEGDIFSWYWMFMPENVVREFVDSSDPTAYRFTAEFSIAGDNSATLRVEIN